LTITSFFTVSDILLSIELEFPTDLTSDLVAFNDLACDLTAFDEFIDALLLSFESAFALGCENILS
jgi:hypothetical protein